MKFFSIPNTSEQRFLIPLFQNGYPLFLPFSPFFWRMSQPLGQDQQNGQRTVSITILVSYNKRQG